MLVPKAPGLVPQDKMRDVLEPPGILRKITATDGYPKQPAQGHLRAGTRAADVWDRHGNALPQEGPLRAGDRGPPAPLPALSQAASGARPPVRSCPAQLVPAVCSTGPAPSFLWAAPPSWEQAPSHAALAAGARAGVPQRSPGQPRRGQDTRSCPHLFHVLLSYLEPTRS